MLEGDVHKEEALRLYNIWMEQERICEKYIGSEPLKSYSPISALPQSIWKDYANRADAETNFREFVKKYSELW